jgi:hypothetical protein
MTVRTLLVALVMVLAAGARVARADDRAAAEAQFVKAKRLMKEGKTAEACTAFETSQQLDPQLGTRYNLAICYQELGKTASAWLTFREVAQLDTNAKRKKDSALRADQLEPRLTKLLITTGTRVTGLRVTRDDVDVTNLMGIEDPIDPGRYHIAASAPGRASWATDVEVSPGEGAVITVEIPALEASGSAVTDPDPRPVEVPARAEVRAGGHRTERRAGRFYGGIGAGVGGVVAVGVGIAFGAKASSRWSEVQDLCGDEAACATQADLDRATSLTADARSAGNLSTVLIGVGAAAIAAGVVLVVTSSHDVTVAPSVDAERVGLVAAGRF